MGDYSSVNSSKGLKDLLFLLQPLSTTLPAVILYTNIKCNFKDYPGHYIPTINEQITRRMRFRRPNEFVYTIYKFMFYEFIHRVFIHMRELTSATI